MNPGSNEARIAGCKCPILDNNHGRGYMGMKDVFVKNGHCPLHGEHTWTTETDLAPIESSGTTTTKEKVDP
jgi:hypothetical protein